MKTAICSWWLFDILIINFIGAIDFFYIKLIANQLDFAIKKRVEVGVTLKRAKSIITLKDHQLLSHLIILKHDF